MIRSQRGLTLIELLVTTAIVMVVIMTVTNSLKMASTFLNQVRARRNRDRIISSQLQDVVQNVSLFQKNFDLSVDDQQKLLDPAKLPIAWNQDVIVDAAQCPSCPGRMGFLIQPVPSMIGLNQLTIRITHSTLIQGYRDYVFILSDD